MEPRSGKNPLMARQFVKISSVRGKQGGSAVGESIKVASFQKVQSVCQISKKNPNHYLNLKFEFPAHNSKHSYFKLIRNLIVPNQYPELDLEQTNFC